ncbi:MAG: carboxylating nicotinate-nucleotide diphosphorylase [Rickettsiales bacterium]|nr:carboxylating nicotinate-nucleotide diphosphorylase [Rickettsiales bacterium]
MLLNPEDIRRIILTALTEDVGHGDITSKAIIQEYTETVMHLVAREPMVVCGTDVMAEVFCTVDPNCDVQVRIDEGARVEAGAVIASIMGEATAILTAERVALNLMQRMCGIATETAKYVKAVEGTSATILDTRKTMPGLRELDKYAVRVGGGSNHRMRLDDAVLIKDNHIAIAGSVAEALRRVSASVPATTKVEVECDRLEQVKDALEHGARMILLDNMSLDELSQAVKLSAGKAKLEASGGVTLETVRAIAETGVDFISVGRITHSVRNLDIGLDSPIEA